MLRAAYVKNQPLAEWQRNCSTGDLATYPRSSVVAQRNATATPHSHTGTPSTVHRHHLPDPSSVARIPHLLSFYLPYWLFPLDNQCHSYLPLLVFKTDMLIYDWLSTETGSRRVRHLPLPLDICPQKR